MTKINDILVYKICIQPRFLNSSVYDYFILKSPSCQKEKTTSQTGDFKRPNLT